MEKLERGAGYAIDIDGPFSLFEQTTKYGLRLALALPAIMASTSPSGQTLVQVPQPMQWAVSMCGC